MEKLFIILEVAEVLGILQSTAKILASQRKFPVVRVGRLIRVSFSALRDWIEKKTELCVGNRGNTKGQLPRRSQKSKSFEYYLLAWKKIDVDEKSKYILDGHNLAVVLLKMD